MQKLKEKHKHHLELQKRGTVYYVFETTSFWNKQKRQNSKISLFIGKISSNGDFSPPVRKRSTTKGIENLDQYMDRLKKSEKAENLQLESETELKILEALSTNARSTVAEISENVGVPAASVAYQIKKSEKKYNIRYTIDTYAASKFGFYRFLITAKFGNRRPNIISIKNTLEKDPHVQLVMATKGQFDLFIVVLFESPVTLEPWLYNLRKNKEFASYPSTWHATYFLIGHGVIPLRDEFFESVVKNKVWHRTRENQRKRSDQIFQREYAVLRALSKDGSTNFNDIDTEYSLKRGSAQYTYHELTSKNIIRRVTISMQNLPIKYNAIIILKQINMEKFEKSRKELFRYALKDESRRTNRFLMTGDLGSPYGIIRLLPVYKDGELEAVEEELKDLVKGVKTYTSIVTDTIVGSICYNKIKKKDTIMYKILKDEFNHIEE